MMNPAYAVIGANFGDEGKGLTTDYLVRKFTTNGIVPMVARGNGGAQAGHTVETKDGKRHVFGHIGAGTFAGADTYLAKNFILNPYSFEKEIEELQIEPRISAHPGCRVTTIYDMALNSLRELARSNRHGSCGMGINETVTRDELGYSINLIDIHTYSQYALAQKLKHIFQMYWKPQFDQLKRDSDWGDEATSYAEMFSKQASFEYDAGRLAVLKHIRMAHPFDPPGYERHLIVEGAQGLQLDEHMGVFPHVTRSITGLPSALLAAAELHYREITPVYVTRAYCTRHGAGPLKGESAPFTNKGIPADKTNVLGPWQGHFRLAPLSLQHLEHFIDQDLKRSVVNSQLLNVKINKPEMMLTHMDQMGSEVGIVGYSNTTLWIPTENLPKFLEDSLSVRVKYLSYGPTAQDVVER